MNFKQLSLIFLFLFINASAIFVLSADDNMKKKVKLLAQSEGDEYIKQRNEIIANLIKSNKKLPAEIGDDFKEKLIFQIIKYRLKEPEIFKEFYVKRNLTINNKFYGKKKPFTRGGDILNWEIGFFLAKHSHYYKRGKPASPGEAPLECALDAYPYEKTKSSAAIYSVIEHLLKDKMKERERFELLCSLRSHEEFCDKTNLYPNILAYLENELLKENPFLIKRGLLYTILGSNLLKHWGKGNERDRKKYKNQCIHLLKTAFDIAYKKCNLDECLLYFYAYKYNIDEDSNYKDMKKELTILENKKIPEELQKLVVSQGGYYLKLRDSLLEKYNLVDMKPSNYKNPAFHLAVTILKGREKNPKCFDKLALMIEKERDFYSKAFSPKFASDIEEQLRRLGRWPNGNKALTGLDIDKMERKLVREGKSKKEVDEILSQIREKERKKELERRKKEPSCRQAVKIAILEYIWKLSKDTKSYVKKKKNKSLFDAEREGIIMYLDYLAGKTISDMDANGIEERFAEFGGKENVAWIIMEYLYNIRSIDFHNDDARTRYMEKLLTCLRNLNFYGSVSMLEEMRKEYEPDYTLLNDGYDQAELLDKTIKEFKYEKAPQIKWKGLIQKWGKQSDPN